MDNTVIERNGGKWALSGFFYQAVGVASLVARAHNVSDQDLEGDDLDAMVEIGGLVPESFYDQDAILFPVNGMLENQCAFYQFKYSGSANRMNRMQAYNERYIRIDGFLLNWKTEK